ncbi:protein with putative role during mitosis, partial [Quaeritorhiza haematococci]
MATSSLLSGKQKDELRLAILDYLHTNGLTASFKALQEEAGLSDFVGDGKQKYSGLLEKKWTSVIRLQKKIMDLESKTTQLQEELSSTSFRPTTSSSASASSLVPRPPEKFSLTGHRSSITRVAFHPLFTVLASASEDATIKIWDYESGEFERTCKGHTKAVMGLAFDGRGEKLVSCSADLTIKIWDTLNSYNCIRTLHGHDHSVSSVSFLPPRGDLIVSSSRDKTIKVWEVASGFCVRTLVGHEEWVREIVPCEDGRVVASGSNDQTIRIWDPATGECKAELRGHEHVVECVIFAPTSSYQYIRELIGAAETKTKDHPVPGQYVISGSRDKTIKIWDTTTSQCLHTLTGHDNWIRGLTLPRTGRFLISASDDKSLKVWELRTGRCVKTISEAH